MNFFEHLKSASLIEPLGWTILHSIWQGVAVAVLAAIALRIARSRSPQARYAVACIALLALAISVCATFAHFQPLPSAPTKLDASPFTAIPVTNHFGESSRSWPVPSPQTLAERIRPVLPGLALAWLAGVLLLGTYHTGGWIMLRRLCGQSRAVVDVRCRATFRDLLAEMHVVRPVLLRESTLVQVPSVVGWISPMILLPVSAMTGLSPFELRGLLAHELAHIRRNDYLVNLLQTAIETLLFYHPAAWWLGRMIRLERENCCDDLAAAVCDRTTYAQALATMESLRQSPRGALSAKCGALLQRIHRILGLPAPATRRPIKSAIASAAILAAVMVGVTVLSACSAKSNPSFSQENPPIANAKLIGTVNNRLGQGHANLQLRVHTKDNQFLVYTTTNAQGQFATPPLIPGDYAINVNDPAANDPQLATVEVRANQTPQIELHYDPQPQPLSEELAKAQSQYVAATIQLAEAQDSLKSGLDPLTVEQMVNANALLSQHKATVEAYQSQYEKALDRLGETNPTTIQLKKALEREREKTAAIESDARSKARTSYLQELNGTMSTATKQRDAVKARVESATGEHPAIPQAGEYYISGVLRTGAYAIGEKPITLLQALISAGLDQRNKYPKLIVIHADGTRRELKVADVVKHADGQIPVQVGDVLMVVNDQPEGEYYIDGDVPRVGVYSLTGREISVLQALISAGADPQKLTHGQVIIRRRVAPNQVKTLSIPVKSLLDDSAKETILQPYDQLEVRNQPTTQPATRPAK